MDSERWRRVKEILYAALERPIAERSVQLDQLCAGDEALRRDVESLLIAHDRAGAAVDMPAFEMAARLLANNDTDAMVGRRIGVYEIVREIGHGGMGAVYLAVRADDQYRKNVAIKLIKRGMDSEFILRRFRHERQILANLEHPNIARLLDGGATEEGLPYLVMEYVEGVPIIDYCREHQLSVRDRLQLFRTVCAVVHYAHQNLVVHRDIKPSNILVSRDGVPKLLDFGIAKLLNPEGAAEDATVTTLRLMTPDYASPEQVKGGAITTATDVYSLGILLYELLGERRPYRLAGHSAQEVEAIICEEEPPPPSAGQSERVQRLLRGDLDNIVLKALRKEPVRRYASVDQLSEDIRRHLDGLPVTARKDTFGYRAGKLVRRNKASVLAASLVVLTLIGGIVATAMEARVARAQRQRAENRFNDVRALANSFMFEIHDSIQNLDGATPARVLLVKRALQYLDSLAREASGDRTLQRELATAYEKVGDIQGDPYGASLGDTKSALSTHRKSRAIRAGIIAAEPANRDIRRELASSDFKIGDILWVTGDWKGALASYQQARAVNEELLAENRADRDMIASLALNYQAIGDTLLAIGDFPGSLDHHRKSLAMLQQLAAKKDDAEIRRRIAVAHVKIGEVLDRQGSIEQSLQSYGESERILEALQKADPENARVRMLLSGLSQLEAVAFRKNGQLREARDAIQRSLEITEKQAAADPTNVVAQRNLSAAHNGLCTVLGEAKEFSRALDHCRKQLAISETLSAADPDNTQAKRDVATAYVTMADVQISSDDLVGAEKNARKAFAIVKTLAALNPTNTMERADLFDNYWRLGRILVKRGVLPEGLAMQQEAIKIAEGLVRDAPTNAEYHSSLAKICFDLGATHRVLAAQAPRDERRAQLREAEAWYRRSLDTYVQMRKQGMLVRSEQAKPDELAVEVEKCERELARAAT